MAASARGGVSRWTAGAFLALVAMCASTLSERGAFAQTAVTLTVGLTVEVDDVSTGTAWTNMESTGAEAFDSALLSWNGPIPTGTVTYDFYTNATCAGVYTVTDPETIDGAGNVNHSFFTTPLGAGTYSYQATYSGDVNYPSSQAACQPFTVQPSGSATVATSVFDDGTASAWSSSEVTGASAYDTATVSGTGGVTPTGSVTYSLYANGSCTGTPSSTETVSLSNGSVPNSSATAALGAGAYSYQATYSGDSSYQGATGTCEGFAVAQASDSFVAAVYDASNNQPWSGTETQGASAYDAASLGATGTGFTPSGTVTYALFQSAGCAGNASSTETVTVTGGSVPASSTTPGLPAGTYSYQVSYSGDANFTSATVCNTFTVNSNPLTISPPSQSNVIPGSTVTLLAQGGTGIYTQWALTTDGSGALQPQAPFGASLSYVVGPNGNTTDIVQVTDSSGATAQATIGIGPGISISVNGSTPIPPMGSINLSATGGSGGPYSWNVTTDNSGANTPLSSGTSTTYTAGSQGGVTDTITASDTYGNTATVQIPVGAGIAITANPSGTLGPGEPVTLTASGGSSSGYHWTVSTNASGGSSPSPVTGGSTSYTPGIAGGAGGATDTVQVTDSLGNVGSIAVKVGPTLAMADPQGLTTPPLGTLQFTVSGGWSSCTNGYQWSVSTNNSGANVDATGLYTAGTQGGSIDTVTVTDCANNSASMSVTVTAGVSITAAPSTTTWPHGQVALTASGGSGTFSAWSFTTTGSGSPQLSATLGASTTYTAGATANSQDVVQVKDSLGNVASITLSVGAGITITNFGGTSTPPMGSLQFSASGGSGNYTSWVVSTNGSGAGPISPSSSTTGGQVTYTAGSTGGVSDTITVTDSSGNTASVNVSVGGGIAINPANPSTPPRGSVSFGATGGSGAGFKWAIIANGSGGSIGATTGAYVAGGAGNTQDTVQVTDSLGNTGTTIVTVGPGVSISPSSATVAPLGVATFSASGGSGTGYSWSLTSNSSGGNVVGGAYKAGPTGGGVDVVQVVDSLGNVATANVNVTAALTLAPSSPSTPPRGSLTFSAMGGAKPYKWSLQTNGSGGSINPGTGLYVAGSTGGTTDTVLVTDGNGATASTVVAVTAGITITPATPSTPPGGTLDFMATGGSGTGYAWAITTNLSGGSINSATGVYVAGTTAKVTDVVRVTDSLGNMATVSVSVGGGIAISPNSPTVPPRGGQTFTAMGGSGSGYAWKLTASPSGGSVNASTGVYTAGATPNVTDVLQVTDSLGNTASTSITVGAGVAINPASTTSAPLGTVHFSASGGSGNGYTYSLTTNASGGKIDPTTGTYTAGALGNVTDFVQVVDSLGNSTAASVKVTAAIAIAPTSASVPPRGGASFTASGGTGTYAFALQTNASGGSVTAQGVYTAGATPNVVDVVGVVDTNGATATATVTVGAGVTLSPVGPSVAPGGKVQFTAMGGSGTGFLWTMPVNQSGGGISVGGAYTAGSTGKTVDTVKVSDSLGNSATTQVSVGGGLAINPSTASTSPLGKVSFSAVGGAGGYVFSLGTNASGGAVDKMGNYTAGTKGSVTDVVTVTDSAGTTASANVTVGPGVTVTPATATVTTGGTIPFSVSGGSGTAYAWTIQPNQSGGTIDPKTGVYKAGTVGGVVDTVLVRDSLGNMGSASVTVKGNPMMGGDGGVDSGTTDSGMPGDGGKPDGAGGNDGSTSNDGAPSGDGGNQDSGFEVDGSGIDGGAGPGNSNGSCGCSVVGVDGEGFGALGGLALGLALLARRRRTRTPH